MIPTTTMNPRPQNAPVGVEPYITKETLAERLATHPDTVGKWFCSGRLPGYRIGRRLRFKWSEVEKFLAQTCKRGARINESGASR